MGISSDFPCEIRDILDMTCSCWMQNEEEIMSDMATCAKAFRLLRMNGYDINSDGMAQFAEQSCYDDSIHAYLNDIQPWLELYRSSQVRFSEDDLILENICSWSAKLLKQQLSSRKISKPLVQEIEYAPEFPIFATVEPLEHKGNIERFKTNSFQLVKSGHCGSSSANTGILSLAIDKFQSTQSVFQQELQDLHRWVKEHRLDELKFARILPLHTCFCAIVPLFPPELFVPRVALSQNAVLTTAVDDLFDGGGSMKEMRNMVELFEKCMGAMAAQLQNRSVMDHLVELWVVTVRTMMTEAEWVENKYIPTTMEEYMPVAEHSFAFNPIIPTSVYLIGEPLPEEVVRSEEYTRLLQHANTVGRLINDV
uniref:Uncharacterized protein n=1 Tax=Oryza brachyantha TaxID=4533 RepID=J3KUM5_ORYBR